MLCRSVSGAWLDDSYRHRGYPSSGSGSNASPLPRAESPNPAIFEDMRYLKLLVWNKNGGIFCWLDFLRHAWELWLTNILPSAWTGSHTQTEKHVNCEACSITSRQKIWKAQNWFTTTHPNTFDDWMPKMQNSGYGYPMVGTSWPANAKNTRQRPCEPHMI